MSISAAPTVKICGLQSVEVLKSIVHLPIDHIGFVFAKSKRQVTSDQAAAMIALLEAMRQQGEAVPLTVGVFVNPTEDELERVLAAAPLDVVQLHGDETPGFCRLVKERFRVQVFKVVSLPRPKDTNLETASFPTAEEVELQLEPYRGAVDAILLDTHDPVYGGGSGKTFTWSVIPVYLQWARMAGIKLLVAGGLEPDNVGSLIANYAPDGVDVSSGVETDGRKDISKITSFVERVTQRGASASS
jgi:phosphoribosylanthranilate isomerase